MKSIFSTSWKSSKQPRKQRKYLYNLPLFSRGKLLHAHLSKELREKLGKRSLRVRTGDKVKILRGDFKGKEGKVERVNLKEKKVYVGGIIAKKQEGGNALKALNASNLMIIALKEDKKRLKNKSSIKNVDEKKSSKKE